MTNEAKRIALVHRLNLLGEQLDERYPTLTNKQMVEIEGGIESLWRILCRRGVK